MDNAAVDDGVCERDRVDAVPVVIRVLDLLALGVLLDPDGPEHLTRHGSEELEALDGPRLVAVRLLLLKLLALRVGRHVKLEARRAVVLQHLLDGGVAPARGPEHPRELAGAVADADAEVPVVRVLHAGGREEVERRDRLERADDRLLRDDLAPLPHGVALDADDRRPESRRAVDAGETDELLDLAGPVALHHVVVDLPLHAVGPLLALLLHLRLDHGAHRLRVLGRHLRRHGHPILLRDLGDVAQGHGLRNLDDVVLQLGDGRRLEVDEHLAVGEELVDPRLGGVDLVLGKWEVDVRESCRVDVRELCGGILTLELA